MSIARKLTKASVLMAGVLFFGFVVLAIDDGGPVETREVPAPILEAIHISHGLAANIVQGDPTTMKLTGRTRDIARVLISFDGTDVTLHRDGNLWTMAQGLVDLLLGRDQSVTIDIALPALTHLEASMGASASAKQLANEALTISADTGANIMLAGRADSLRLNAQNGANIVASDLLTQRTEAEASTGANVLVNARQSIRARSATGASIVVDGAPVERDVDNGSGANIVIK